MKRKIILNLAISIDGYISKNNGGFDWIKGDGDKSHDTKEQFDFSKFTDSIDIIVMGRKAYEDCPIETMESFKSKKIYVATSQKLKSKYDNINLVYALACGFNTHAKTSDLWIELTTEKLENALYYQRIQNAVHP